MAKTILLTGATDGIGLLTAEKLVSQGHTLLLHGRNPEKLTQVADKLDALPGAGAIETYTADLSRMSDVEAMVEAVTSNHDYLNVLINNAGIFKTDKPITADGLDIRFVVNTLAPYLLTQRLLPILGKESRVVNLSSAAQAPVDRDVMAGSKLPADEMAAYAQSKLAITAWSYHMAKLLKEGPMVVAVNPGSLLASKMVKEGFGVEGNDLSIGADILVRAALSEAFSDASGKYYDNDAGGFGTPHPDVLDTRKCQLMIELIEDCLGKLAA